MSSWVSSWTLMVDFFVQECCIHDTDLENQGPNSIDDVYCLVVLQLILASKLSELEQFEKQA